MKPPTLRLTGESAGRTFYFAPETGSGWATATLNDTTGELAIQSDWGDWAYRWHVTALGARAGRTKTLTEFVAEGDEDYLARKLCPSGSLGEVDFDALRAEVREDILTLRRARALDAETASYLWEFVGSAEFESDWESRNASAWDSVVANLTWPVELPMRDTWEFNALRDGVLPAVVAACRGTQ